MINRVMDRKLRDSKDDNKIKDMLKLYKKIENKNNFSMGEWEIEDTFFAGKYKIHMFFNKFSPIVCYDIQSNDKSMDIYFYDISDVINKYNDDLLLFMISLGYLLDITLDDLEGIK